MNTHAVRVIYKYEMLRAWETLLQSFVSPVLSTSLYFVVFGSAIGSRIEQVEGVSYGAFIVPGLIMLVLLNQSITNASFGIFFPKFTGTIYEVMSAPISFFEILLGYGSSRQGCESWRVKVPLPSVARNGRLVYPLLGEVTN